MTDERPADDLTDLERRLRDALAAEAASVEPDPDGLGPIQERIMSTESPPSRTRWYVAGGVAAAVALVVGLVVGLDSDDDPDVTADDPTTTETSPTTTSSSTTTTSTTEPAFDLTTDPSVVVFPAVDTSQRFQDPTSAAFAFATQYAGFADPVLSDFMQGDRRSGEFELRADDGGPVSIVLVRQLEDDTWGVIGAETDRITVEEPETDDVISSPVEVSGSGLDVEGTITVDVREQGRTESIGQGSVTAGGSPPGDVYSGEIDFSEPRSDTGAVMHRELGADDGTTSWVSITRVRFVPEE